MGDVVGDHKSTKFEGFVVSLKGGRCFAVYQSKSGRFTLYSGRASYERGQTAYRAPLVYNEYVELSGDFGSMRVYMMRPEQDTELYIIATREREALGLVTTEPLPLNSTITVNDRKPIALYEVRCKAGDSFDVTVEPSERHTIDVKLCQGHPRYTQVLANARVASSQSLRCTLPDDGPMVVVITPYAGEGTYTLHAKRVEGKVKPQPRDNPFRGVRFGIFGKEPAPFTPHLAAGGIIGEKLDGRLAETDLNQFDVIIILTNAVRRDHDGEVPATAEKLKGFVKQGGGLVVFQQHGTQRWDDAFLPYPLELLHTGWHYKPCVVKPAGKSLLDDFRPQDIGGGPHRPVVGFYAVNLAGNTDKQWRVLAHSGESSAEALAVACDYSKGKVIFNQFAVLDRITEPIMRTIMSQTVRYVVAGE